MDEITIRECTTIDEIDRCVDLQREGFGLPDIEISPRRHLIVSRQVGGWTLGAFINDRMVGFVHHLVAVRPDNEIYGYSHMMAVAKDVQNKGVGARLKWAQRARAMGEGRGFIKWTWDPMQARNAHFNLNRLGVIVDNLGENYYGTDYYADPEQEITGKPGLQSDRLFASWYLNSPRVVALAKGLPPPSLPASVGAVAIPANWAALIKADVERARHEQQRVRAEFLEAFEKGLVCSAFERGDEESRYLFFNSSEFNL